MSDDFDDFIDKIKKYFRLDSDVFDVDFLFIPESEKSPDLKPKNSKAKAFKISYHFEKGMKEPEFKIEGDIDEKKIKEYLKNMDLSRYPDFEKLIKMQKKDEIDADKISLELPVEYENQIELEPATEINNYKDFIEVVFDIPGISEEDVIIDITEGGSNLRLVAENTRKRYIKDLDLPFKCSNNDCEIEVKNGLAIIKVKKLDK
ncbi:MAG: Hsp20/alpha crystallin family protein [Candidatus Odinarchaeota archaeon]